MSLPFYLNQTILKIYSNVFEDSKFFVDSCLIKSQDDFFNDFNDLYRNYPQVNNQTILLYQKLYYTYFLPPSIQFHLPNLWAKADLNQNYPFSEWMEFLFKTFQFLMRKPNEECPNSSLLHTKYPFVVPGGRFNEFYYWDSFWMMKGLIYTNLRIGMLYNFKQFVLQYGFIPNGNRHYYLNRSQPPLFTFMVYDEFKRTQNLTFLTEFLPILDLEYQWWINNRAVPFQVDGETFYLNIYNATSEFPRPESFKEDLETAKETPDRNPSFIYSNLASGAESGWDFSSRWLLDQNLGSVSLTSLIPVDLNAILCANERILSKLHAFLECVEETNGSDCFKIFPYLNFNRRDSMLEQMTEWRLQNISQSDSEHVKKKQYYARAHDLRSKLIQKYLWHSDLGIWLDYDLTSGQPRTVPKSFQDYHLYLSSLFPIWLETYSEQDISSEQILHLILNFNQSFFGYPGGIPTSLHSEANQQWDFPNAWPPLQWITIEAILNLPSSLDSLRNQLAPTMIQKWINANYCGWRKENPDALPVSEEEFTDMIKRSYKDPTHLKRSNGTRFLGMYEKYDVLRVGQPGGGGEYKVQEGFGWTNGVVLDFIRRFSKDSDLLFGLPMPPDLGWWHDEGELELLHWQDGLQLPSEGVCASLLANSPPLSISPTTSSNVSTSSGPASLFIFLFIFILLPLTFVGFYYKYRGSISPFSSFIEYLKMKMNYHSLNQNASLQSPDVFQLRNVKTEFEFLDEDAEEGEFVVFQSK